MLSQSSGRAVGLERRPHVLFLNTQDVLRADVSVHVSLAGALERTQVRVTVASNRNESPGDSARSAFEAIPDLRLLLLDLGQPQTGQRGFGRLVAALRNLRAVLTLLWLAAWCRWHGVDLIHVTERPRDALFGMLLARMAGAALLVHGHTSYYPQGRVVDWLLRHADAVVGVSEFTASTFWRDGGLARDRIYALHNAVDASTLATDVPLSARHAFRQRYDISADAPVIGVVGRLMRGKDQATVVEALPAVLEAVPDARLIIAGRSTDVAPDGGGSYGEYLVRRAQELGVSHATRLTGLLPHDEMPTLFSAMDVFVHPCVEEPFGLVLVEAMAMRRPVVGVARGGVPEIIRNQVDGLLVAPRDPQATAQAITTILKDPLTAERLAEAGRQRVLQAFTPQVQAAKMLEIYRHILGHASTIARARELESGGFVRDSHPA